MRCPRCRNDDPHALMFCTQCGASLQQEHVAKRGGGDILIMVIAIAVAAVVIVSGAAYFLFVKEKPTAVSLISNGKNVGSVPVSGLGFVDLNKMERIEATLSNGSLNLGGWYYDPEFKDPFFKYRRVTSSISLYADWNELSFTMTQVPTSPVSNSETCTFKNNTPGATDTAWTIKDAFKTNNHTVVENVSGSPTYTNVLKKGMYEVTMTATVNGEEKRLTKLETVKGTVTIPAVTWQDYYGNARTLPAFSFDVQDYIKLARDNRARDFRIANIAGFVSGTDALIQSIANGLVGPSGLMPGGTMQERADLIASFVNDGLSIDATPASKSDSTYYMIPGFHTSAVSVEYYKYPVESLYDKIQYGGMGDCEDHAILTAAIARAAGFDVAIIVITNPSEQEGHAIAGIKNDLSFVPPFEPPDSPQGAYSFKEVNGYYSCETFRPSSATAKRWLGLVETKYTEPGWVLRSFPVRG